MASTENLPATSATSATSANVKIDGESGGENFQELEELSPTAGGAAGATAPHLPADSYNVEKAGREEEHLERDHSHHDHFERDHSHHDHSHPKPHSKSYPKTTKDAFKMRLQGVVPDVISILGESTRLNEENFTPVADSGVVSFKAKYLKGGADAMEIGNAKSRIRRSISSQKWIPY